MLDELVVSNLGVIEEGRLEPGKAFTVITGETGTGKTLLLGALRMLLGADAKPELVGPFGDEAKVEGRFVPSDGIEIAAARRLPRDGRSKAYLDGNIASAAGLDEATASMVELIGQHDQLRLTRASEVRRLIDRHLTPAQARTKTEYLEAYATLRELEADRDRLGGGRVELERERGLVEYQLEEIDKARIDLDSDLALEGRIDRLRHADTIRQHLAQAADLIEDARERFSFAIGEIRRADHLAGGSESARQANAVEAELNELARLIAGEADELELDPQELAEAEERMQVLGDLRRKYGTDLQAVIGYRDEMEARHRDLTELLDRADRIDKLIEEAMSDVERLGGHLRDARRRAGEELAGEARRHLTELGFSNPAVAVSVEEAHAGGAGADRVAIRFASDARLALGDIAKVASGGELSRLVLALRLAGGAGEAQTLVFDEVDAGIGGSTALAVGRKLAGLALDRQVLCVTHLPQVAAFADTHYVIRRDDLGATVHRVEGTERLDELSRMLSGLPEADKSKEAAEELLSLAQASSGDSAR